MISRNKYVITLSEEAARSPHAVTIPETVYADEVRQSPNGDFVFFQFRTGPVIDDKGERVIGPLMSTVLLLKREQYAMITQVNEDSDTLVPFYKESGRIVN